MLRINTIQALHLDTALKDILQTHKHCDTPTLPIVACLVAQWWSRSGSEAWPSQH